MSNTVIVALPSEMDKTWEISSEKKPHLTLLFLGETPQVPNIAKILDFTEHAARTSLKPFSLDVDYRGTLGADEADVLFYKKSWGYQDIATFRQQLLQNENIKKAFDSQEQFDGWTPHLTLGYPATPAKKLDHPIYYTDFDRIAVWFGDFEGPEFRLEYPDYSLEEVDVAMTAATRGATFVEDVLQHHGVKGMKWGVRRQRGASRSPVAITTTTKSSARGKAKVKAKGGKFHEAHPDAVKAHEVRQKIRKSGTNAASNHELQQLAQRLNLEVQVKNLERQAPANPGKAFVQKKLKDPATRKRIVTAAKRAGAVAAA